MAIIDPGSPALRDRKLTGQRFRCSQVLPSGAKCNGIGLPSIDSARGDSDGLTPARSWPDRLARHATRLRDKR